jgi:inner membrane protein
MDSVSQLALGSAIGIAVMGRRTAVWKAALWGGVCGTLPDLDALIDFGDAVRNMTYHRAESHALFYLTLASPVLAWIASRVHGEQALFKRWWLALWLVLITHPLLDAFTIYGTQLLLPLSDHPFGVGSIFIIDPLYTLPLLIGVVAALAAKSERALHWNQAGLALSTVYLAWTVAAQAHVHGIVQDHLAARGTPNAQFFATPTAFNTVLWRVVVMREGGYEEGFYSLLDARVNGQRVIRFDAFNSDQAVYESVKHLWAMQRMEWFTHGFFSLREQDGRAILSDLRMGQEPNYVFTFVVAQRQSPQFAEVTPTAMGGRGDIGKGLAWVWTRLQGNDIAPPR